MLQIYNTLTRQKETFQSIVPQKVGIYVCGMTVYDHCHLGHGRVLVVFDSVVRYLRALGYDVTYIRNITDIDDKIIRRAEEAGEDFRDLTKRFIEAMHVDCQALNVLAPNLEPKATEAIAQIIALVQVLIDKGFAYPTDSGDVYYAINKFAEYGRLANKKLDELQAGARVEVDAQKRDPMDFVLWKTAKPGEPQWPSPWGAGRPGWHIECSAMSIDSLGNHFDIHGGGMDLQFPHHENEIAQSEAATGEKYVNTWMHNGFVRINDEKMSKSLGNFFTIREILQSFRGEEIRYCFLASHYRSPLNYSTHQLENARAALTRLYTALREASQNIAISAITPSHDDPYVSRFFASMNDDFNTPEALAVLFDLAHNVHQQRPINVNEANRLGSILHYLGGILGLLQRDPEQFFQEQIGGLSPDDNAEELNDGLNSERIEALIEQRLQARQNKDWAAADRIREELKNHGIVLEDGQNGTQWRRSS